MEASHSEEIKQKARKSIFDDAIKLIAAVIKATESIQPTYEHEFCLYSKKLRKNIKEFEEAKSGFDEGTSKLKPGVKNIEEEVISSNVYRGRCLLLRKIGFKTNRLRTHQKTVRPLRYFTLNKVVFDGPKGEKVEIERSPDDKFKKNRQLQKRMLKRRKKDIQKSKMPASTRILEKLREGKKGTGTAPPLATCVCENSKEVTFIIKGVCLCDKSKMKHLAATDTCGEYCRQHLDKASHEPYATDSLEIYRRRGLRRNADGEDKMDEPVDKPNRSVTFGGVRSDADDMTESETTDNREKQAKKEEKKLEPDETGDNKREGNANDDDKEKTEDREMTGHEKGKKCKQTEEAGKPEEKQTKNDESNKQTKPAESSSLIVLFKNKNTTDESKMALTKELQQMLDDKREANETL